MKTIALLASVPLVALLGGAPASAQDDAPAQAPDYGATPDVQPPPPVEQQDVPPPIQSQQGSQQGQWVETADGWIWVPAGTQPDAVGDTPYVYLYTPTYGWIWFVSPWGWGPYAYGPWVHNGLGRGWYGGRGYYGGGRGYYGGGYYGGGHYYGGGRGFYGGGHSFGGGGGGHFGGGGGGGHGGGHR